MAAKTKDFFESGTARQFGWILGLYDEALRIKAESKSSKPENIIKLDKWYQNDLPKKIKGRGKDAHLTHEELVQTIKWKLARGKFRPNLTNLIQMNTPRVVVQETKKAFRNLQKKMDVQAAASSLCNLKGVGPAMASAVLAAGAPHLAPFMADECLLAMPDVDSLDYTMKEYMSFVDHIKACCERLNTGGGEWIPHQVELAVWTYYVIQDLKPELLQDIPSSSEANISAAATAAAAAATNSEEADNNGQSSDSNEADKQQLKNGQQQQDTEDDDDDYDDDHSHQQHLRHRHHHHHDHHPHDHQQPESAEAESSDQQLVVPQVPQNPAMGGAEAPAAANGKASDGSSSNGQTVHDETNSSTHSTSVSSSPVTTNGSSASMASSKENGSGDKAHQEVGNGQAASSTSMTSMTPMTATAATVGGGDSKGPEDETLKPTRDAESAATSDPSALKRPPSADDIESQAEAEAPPSLKKARSEAAEAAGAEVEGCGKAAVVPAEVGC